MNRNKKLHAKRKKAKIRNARQAEYRDRPRTCGDCRACCFVFPLLDKPARRWCQHSTPQGCDCYTDRPSVCGNYKCLYLKDKRCPTSWRPDRSGIIITDRGNFRGHPVLYLSEYWDNAIEGVRGDVMFSALRKSNAILMYNEGDGVGVCCSHTGLVLDDDGKAELMQFMIADTKRESALLAEEPFDFCGDEPGRCCSPKREPGDKRVADLGVLSAS